MGQWDVSDEFTLEERVEAVFTNDHDITHMAALDVREGRQLRNARLRREALAAKLRRLIDGTPDPS